MTGETKSERLDSIEKCEAWNPHYDWKDRRYIWWHLREDLRRSDRALPQIAPDILGYCAPYFVHCSKADPLKIAYTPSTEYGQQDRQVVTSVGRFLTKYFNEVYTAEQIRDFADAHRARFGEPIVHFAFDAKDIEDVYVNGPASCMSHRELGDHHEHPSRVYDGPDTVVAAIRTGPNKYSARTIVRVDNTPMTYGRVYGDTTLLAERLKRLGFQQQSGLDGARLRLAIHNDRPICPYIDGSEEADVRDAFLYIGEGDWNCQQTGGHAYMNDEDEDDNSFSCDYCGDRTDHDDGYSTVSDAMICEYCAEHHFSSVICNSYGDENYVLNDDVIEVDGNYYRDDERLLASLGFVRLDDGEWTHGYNAVYVPSHDANFRVDDTCTPRGRDEPYLTDDCTYIGGEWVHDDDTTEIDGVRMHVDDVPSDEPTTTEPA